MMKRSVTLTIAAVAGLLFLTGTGCGEKDKSAHVQNQMLMRELALKEQCGQCKAGVLSQDCHEDNGCVNAKLTALANCPCTM